MCPRIVLVHFLLFVAVYGTVVEISEIILKIRQESNLETLCVVETLNGEDYENSVIHSLATTSEMKILYLSSLENNFESVKVTSAILLVHGQSQQYLNRQLEMLQKLIEKIDVRKFVLTFGISFRTLQKYFEFFDARKFTRIFGITDQNLTYAYLPYADEKFQKLTSKQSLPDALKDLNGYAFQTVIPNDVPRIFWYNDSRGNPQLGGFAGGILSSFLRQHKALVQEIYHSSVADNNDEVKKLLFDNKIAIVLNNLPPENGFSHCKTLQTRLSVIVPISGYINPNEYFQRPFQAAVWTCIVLSGLYVAVMDFLMKRLLHPQTEFWGCLSQMILAFLQKSPETTSRSAYRIQIQVLVYTFIIANMYLIVMTSFLTVYIKIKQIDSIEDLVESNMSIIMTEFFWNHINTITTVPKGVEQITKFVDFPTFKKSLNSMKNTDYAFCLGEERSRFLVKLQSSYGKPLFKVVPFRDAPYSIGFLLNLHSPFVEIIDTLIMHITEAGLIGKWSEDAYQQAISAGFSVETETYRDFGEPVAMTVETLEFAWNRLIAGYVISTVVFFGEILTNAIRKRIKN